MSELTFAEIHWDAGGQPLSAAFDDVYFARGDGLAESQYVFLECNNLAERWRDLPAQPDTGAVFTIAETGFGTGLNLLATIELWRRCAPPGGHLHFVSIEQFPLRRQDLARALSLWPQLQVPAQRLLEVYQPVRPGHYRWPLYPDVTLTLIFADALEALPEMAVASGAGLAAREAQWGPFQLGSGRVDAWFLDGFAPAKNPGMWTEALFAAIAKTSGPDTTFATFTAAGHVRRGLAAVGFEVAKVPGYGSKREMLCGRMSQPLAAQAGGRAQTNWHVHKPTLGAPKHMVVIGAGLAGAHTAARLAAKGMQVTVLEADEIAAGASGNAQGALYVKLSAGEGTLGAFNQMAYEYAERFYREQGLFARCGDAPGLLQLAQSSAEVDACQRIAKRYPDWVHWVDSDAASTLAGIPLACGGLHFPHGGWLRPAEVCRALLNHANIRVQTHTPVAQCRRAGQQWLLTGPQDEALVAADGVILCCAHAVRSFTQTQHLPVKPIRGQVDLTPPTPGSRNLRAVICASGYIAPLDLDHHCIGATYGIDQLMSEASADDTAENLAKCRGISPALAQLHADPACARVSFRCASPDYLPILGAVADIEAMRGRFAVLGRNFKSVIDEPGIWHDGLFVNVAHGSRGLAYTPLAAELLSEMVLNRPLPVARSMALALHSARFIIRDIKRRG